MSWQQWFCPDSLCTTEIWMVRRNLVARDLWQVAAHVDGPIFSIAATDPVCPRCGTTLRVQIEREGESDRQGGADVGPAFDFVRSLP
jgi:hypothetical protein